MKTKVIFRKYPKSKGGDIIALFPTETGSSNPYHCSSYQHTGQHSAAEPTGVIKDTKAAKAHEYKALAAELRGLGYKLEIIQRYRYEFLTIRTEALKRQEEQALVNSIKVIVWPENLSESVAKDFWQKAGFTEGKDFQVLKTISKKPFIRPLTQMILAQDALELGFKTVRLNKQKREFVE